MSNNISLVGSLGKDSETKTIGEHTLLEFSIANSTGFGDKKKTTWYRCSIWGKRGEKLKQYLLKGTKAFVTGELSISEYTNKDGVNKYSADIRVSEVTLMGSKDSSSSNNSSSDDSEDMPF